MRKSAVFLILLAGLIILTGCSRGKDNQEPVTLTVYSQLANYSGEMTGWFAQELLERFNVKVIIVPDAMVYMN